MTSTTARIKLLKNVLFGGKACAAGTVITVDVEDALAAVEMMKATFVDDADRERALQARRDAIRKMLQAGNPWLQPGTSSAWQRTH